MGIHYDYKSTRGEKALKKEAKKKLEWNKEELEEIVILTSKKTRLKKCTILINL